MKITKMEEQGIRLALCLAQKDGQMTLPDLAEHERLTEALVAKVMGKLRRGGVVKAVRGRSGGYALTLPAESISVAAVFRALGRPLLQGCYNSGAESEPDPCPHVAECSLRPIWHHLEEKITDVLDSITLADLLEEERLVRARVAKLPQIAARRKRGKQDGRRAANE